jgi:hypothetical protein
LAVLMIARRRSQLHPCSVTGTFGDDTLAGERPA